MAINVTASTISNWQNSKSIPRNKDVKKISIYFCKELAYKYSNISDYMDKYILLAQEILSEKIFEELLKLKSSQEFRKLLYLLFHSLCENDRNFRKSNEKNKITNSKNLALKKNDKQIFLKFGIGIVVICIMVIIIFNVIKPTSPDLRNLMQPAFDENKVVYSSGWRDGEKGYEDRTPVSHGDKIEKGWLIANTGGGDWKKGKVQAVKVTKEYSEIGPNIFVVPNIKHGEEGYIWVDFIVPDMKPGTYKVYWQLKLSNGQYFGSIFGIILTIE